uniref:PRA1 family protein n=1 Tax=Trypanosoma congolense (strain IL3000) TaxID=1068625 RepID=G0UXZ3_TRYCI|nr:putative RAB-interacting protein [Trypanosoma congolense IL3000]
MHTRSCADGRLHDTGGARNSGDSAHFSGKSEAQCVAADFSHNYVTQLPSQQRKLKEKHHSGGRFWLSSQIWLVVSQPFEAYAVLEQERLSWFDDFLDTRQFALPRSMSEVLERLNLNIPFYAANYAILCTTLSFLFLLFINPLLLVLVFPSSLLARSAIRYAKRSEGFEHNINPSAANIAYFHFLVTCSTILLLIHVFLIGLFYIVVLLVTNSVVLLSHAVLRRPVYFHDVELEKLRPKTFQYVILLLLSVLECMERRGS